MYFSLKYWEIWVNLGFQCQFFGMNSQTRPLKRTAIMELLKVSKSVHFHGNDVKNRKNRAKMHISGHFRDISGIPVLIFGYYIRSNITRRKSFGSEILRVSKSVHFHEKPPKTWCGISGIYTHFQKSKPEIPNA